MSNPFAARKNELLDFNPPSIERGTDEEALPPPSSPLEFFDYHVPNNLMLKRVRLLPTLLDDVALLVTSKYKDDLDCLPLDLFGYDRYYYASAENSDARTVHFIREIGISTTCAKIASCVLIHPDEPRIKPVLYWGVSRSLAPPSDSEQYMDRFLIQHLALRVSDHVVGTHDIHSRPSYPAPSAATQKKMATLYENSRVLTVAMMFDASAHPLLADMKDLAAQETFAWELASECTGKQIPAPASLKHSDAPQYPWTIPAASLVLDSTILRRSDRRNSHIRRAPQPGHVKPVVRATSAKDGYIPRAKDYVQRAWANAVKLDSSTMIWDCGNYLRIGIRHRESQTLYLSDLIDVRTCTDPAYGKIWLGLHLAIVSDALERLPILERQRHLPRGVKRTFKEDGAPSTLSREKKKQAKKRQLTAENNVRSLLSSHIAAFYFQTSQYDSPAPALFCHASDEIRDSYSPSEYVMIVLDSRLGTGGTGTVFRACIEPDASSSKPKYCAPFVVKFAYSSKDVDRLRHEYAVYRHLERKGVTGIPRLLGFYEAVDQDDMAALIIAHAGRPLGELRDENHKISLKASEIESLKETLDKIHAAGATHRDIRSWNMMVDRSGDMFIADFDRASFIGSERDIEKETQRFQAFVAGDYVDAWPVVGDDDLASSYSDYIEDTEELKQGASDAEMARYFNRFVAVHWDTRDRQFSKLGQLTSPLVVANSQKPEPPSEPHTTAPRRRRRAKQKLRFKSPPPQTTTPRATVPQAHECESCVRLERCVSEHSLLFEGYLQQRSSSRVGMGQRFIIKVAKGTGPYGKAKLEHEYRTYQRLAGLVSDGLPRLYGFYETIDGTATAGVLFMEKVGKPLCTIKPSEISLDFQLTIENWLRNLHEAGCVHNDLVNNLVVNDSSPWRFCVVSWKTAEFFSQEDMLREEVMKQMEDELDDLRSCFPGNV